MTIRRLASTRPMGTAAKIDIVALEVKEGHLPRRALQFVLEWATLQPERIVGQLVTR